ncbi:MAG TPA: hypothetical protein VGP46_02285 [Acidimicrobiales bacterium]|jgi:hypothetical protein|nr:hypothetical protein [Acidimicrobiales bacterium]
MSGGLDPELVAASAQLGELALRNTAASILDRIALAKARKKDQEVILELEQIVLDLIEDKNQLLRLARTYEEEFVAQKISDNDIEYLTQSLVPILKTLMERSIAAEGGDLTAANEVFEGVSTLLSAEMITILQVIGFNFKRAIGEPLTQLIASLIASRTPANPAAASEIQGLVLRQNLAYLEVAANPESFERLKTIMGGA